MKRCSILFVLVAATASLGCKRATPTNGDAGTSRASEATREQVLRGIGECTASEVASFATKAATFGQKANAAATVPSDATRKEAQDAWVAAIDQWERLEVMQFGPAATKAHPGGQDLRGSIYAWPLTSRCLIEQQIVSKAYEGATFSTALSSSRGLGAAEYLLFYAAPDNACSAGATINADGMWNALGATEIAARRLAYAGAVATDIAAVGTKLNTAWDPAQGNFVNELVKSVRGGSIYKTDQTAFNSVSDALFYVEADVKDTKVAHPLGILNCTTPTCPEGVESPYAKRSLTHIVNNLAGFRKLFFGCNDGNGQAFDDLLDAIGASSINTSVKVALEQAEAALASITSPDLETAIAQQNDKVRAVHTALKKLADVLKTEFVTVLDLELPQRVEGDND